MQATTETNVISARAAACSERLATNLLFDANVRHKARWWTAANRQPISRPDHCPCWTSPAYINYRNYCHPITTPHAHSGRGYSTLYNHYHALPSFFRVHFTLSSTFVCAWRRR